jgi:hypothetical protein
VALEGESQAFHGGAVGARVTAIIDDAQRDAALAAEDAERAEQSCLSDAFEQAQGAYRAAEAAAREVALERAATLEELRRSIAERSQSLVVEADEPAHVREQVEALLEAMAEAEATLRGDPGPAREPEPPAALRPPVREAQPAEATAPAPEAPAQPEPEPEPEQRPATPFGRWEAKRENGQLLALLRMAVAGMTREQLEDELDPALPAAERETLLDDVFGAPHKARQHADRNGANGHHAATERA